MSWSKQEIQAICDNYSGETVLERGIRVKNSLILYKMLQSIYTLGQTSEEKDIQATKEDNGIGFNGVDAYILSAIAVTTAGWMAEKKNNFGLSKGQVKVVAKKLRKYAGQLSKIASSHPAAKSTVNLSLAQDNAQAKLSTASPSQAPTINTVSPMPYRMVEDLRDSLVAEEVQKLRVNNPERFFMDGELSEIEAVRHWTRVFMADDRLEGSVFGKLEAQQEAIAMMRGM